MGLGRLQPLCGRWAAMEGGQLPGPPILNPAPFPQVRLLDVCAADTLPSSTRLLPRPDLSGASPSLPVLSLPGGDLPKPQSCPTCMCVPRWSCSDVPSVSCSELSD